MLSHPTEVRFCSVYAEAVSGGRVRGRARTRLTWGKAGALTRTAICFLKTLMGLVARKSITLSLEAVSTSYEVDIKFLLGAGCLFVRESPPPFPPFPSSPRRGRGRHQASGAQTSSGTSPGLVQIQISQTVKLSLFLVLQIKCLCKAEVCYFLRGDFVFLSSD